MQHLLDDIRGIIAQARERVARSVNHELTVAYWHIGRLLVEDEQKGKERADYGKRLVAEIAVHLTEEFGAGFSANNLWLMRQFYQTLPILHTLSGELTWSHYKYLVRLDNSQKRQFFIAESIKNAWSVRQMERQINSLLYERLLMSQDKENVLAIAKGERHPVKPHEIIKDPTVLEFLGLKPEATYVVVRYSLPADNRQIFASKYQLHLPTEAQLQAEVRKELERFSTGDPE